MLFGKHKDRVMIEIPGPVDDKPDQTSQFLDSSYAMML